MTLFMYFSTLKEDIHRKSYYFPNKKHKNFFTKYKKAISTVTNDYISRLDIFITLICLYNTKLGTFQYNRNFILSFMIIIGFQCFLVYVLCVKYCLYVHLNFFEVFSHCFFCRDITNNKFL